MTTHDENCCASVELLPDPAFEACHLRKLLHFGSIQTPLVEERERERERQRERARERHTHTHIDGKWRITRLRGRGRDRAHESAPMQTVPAH